jgi:hypothetical protein
MKKQLRYLILFCLSVFHTGATLDTFAWGGDITLPATAGYNYTGTRISVAYDGSIYYGRMFSTTPAGPITNWEVLKSRDNGVTFDHITGGYMGGDKLCSALDIICAGEDSADFTLFIARAYIDTVTNDAVLFMDRTDSSGLAFGPQLTETYNYSSWRGWTSLSLATDSREPNTNSSPYVISLVAGKANSHDSVIVWTGNDGGNTFHRRSLYGTTGYIRSVSASVGSTYNTTSNFGRLGVAWNESSIYNGNEWGSIHVMFLYPYDGSNTPYTGPYAIDGGLEYYRHPCIVMSQNTAGGTGPGTSDLRVIITAEYETFNIIYGAVFDSIILKPPSYKWSRISAGSTSGYSSQCHGVFDPLYNNFIFTYYNSVANTLPYVIKSMGSNATDDAVFYHSNYRDLASTPINLMFPRVDMSISRGQAAFGWSDYPNSMFDAEWSVAGISENANTGIQELKLYPNPVADIVNISFAANESQLLNISIMDFTGRIFNSDEYTVNEGGNLLTFSVKNLAAGNYIVQLKGASIFSSMKLVVVK